MAVQDRPWSHHRRRGAQLLRFGRRNFHQILHSSPVQSSRSNLLSLDDRVMGTMREIWNKVSLINIYKSVIRKWFLSNRKFKIYDRNGKSFVLKDSFHGPIDCKESGGVPLHDPHGAHSVLPGLPLQTISSGTSTLFLANPCAHSSWITAFKWRSVISICFISNLPFNGSAKQSSTYGRQTQPTKVSQQSFCKDEILCIKIQSNEKACMRF